MSMNLRDLIVNPGLSLPFRCELDTSRLDFPAVAAYTAPPVAEGVLRNEADTLSLHGRISAELLCVCDRCATEFPLHKETEVDVMLATELQDEENPDYFLLDGEELDLDEVLESCFILDMDTRMLCRDDCKGLCAKCGANLNEGACGCTEDADPRLAVLEQLLDDKE